MVFVGMFVLEGTIKSNFLTIKNRNQISTSTCNGKIEVMNQPSM